MPSLVDDAWEWIDRAEQARKVAGQLTDPGAKAVNPTVLRRRELVKQCREENS